MNSFLRACLAAMFFVLAPASAFAEEGHIDPALIRAYFDRLGENGLSASVLVGEGDRVLLRKSYGLAAENPETPMAPDTLVDIGSLAKQFTATLILMEVEAGVLTLDDPVSEFFPDAPADKRDISIHQLLTHSSGLTEHSEDDFAPMTKAEALHNIFASELAFEPGSGFEYSNSGYTLLAAIIEAAAGENYTDLVRTKLWRANGMRDTGFHGDTLLKKRAVATGYVNGEAQPSPVRDSPVQWGVMGNGGVMSTVGDMRKWMVRLASGKVLPREMLDKLWTPYVKRTESESYAYGWRVYDSPLGRGVWHGGTGSGGNADVAYFPDRELFSIILSNRTDLVVDPDTGQYLKISLPAREARIALTRAIAAGDPSIDPAITLDRSQPRNEQ
ncbi:MAG: serine hydrolase domain-containing protein [Parvularculaceae bacterium]